MMVYDVANDHKKTSKMNEKLCYKRKTSDKYEITDKDMLTARDRRVKKLS